MLDGREMLTEHQLVEWRKRIKTDVKASLHFPPELYATRHNWGLLSCGMKLATDLRSSPSTFATNNMPEQHAFQTTPTPQEDTNKRYPVLRVARHGHRNGLSRCFTRAQRPRGPTSVTAIQRSQISIYKRQARGNSSAMRVGTSSDSSLAAIGNHPLSRDQGCRT